MEPFDPFSATFEEAQAQPNAHEGRGAVWRWLGAHGLMDSRPFYAANPLHGMAQCAMYDLVAPEWLAVAYLKCFRAAIHYKSRTWDEAFGAAHPKGINLASARRAMFNRVAVANHFGLILGMDPHRAVGPALWDEIGRAVGEGKTRAEELYREALQAGIARSAASIRKRAGVPVHRPAKFRKLAGLQKKPR